MFSMKCFYTNAQSLRNKKDELTSYIIEENLNIICITEAWVNEAFYGDSLQEYEIDRYSFYLYQCRERSGGGVALYDKSNNESVLITDIKTNHVESEWVDILKHYRSYRIGAFYIAPDQNQVLDEEMVKEIKVACQNTVKGRVIMGDFNFPDTEWNTLSSMVNRSSVF